MEIIEILKGNLGGESQVNPSKRVTVSEWILNEEEQVYKYTLNHGLNTLDILIEAYDNETKLNEIISFKVIDENSIELSNRDNNTIDVLIVGGSINKVEPAIGAEINDNETSLTTTWSSNKISQEISNSSSEIHTHTNKNELDKITSEKIESWDTKETIEGSQQKATQALNDAKSYSDDLIKNLVGTAPDTLNTIQEIAEALQENDGAIDTITSQIAGKANASHTHNATDITEDTSHRFVTDAEKEKWNNSVPSDYEQIKQDVKQLKSDVGTAKANLINNINSTIDIIGEVI